MDPLYSMNVVPSLKALFIKPDARPFQTYPPICQIQDPDTATLPAWLNSQLIDVIETSGRALDWYMRRDTCPIPHESDREGYNPGQHFDWWLSGLVSHLKVAELYAKHTGKPLKGGDAYLEIGCASGRILRHAVLQPEEPLRAIGCDINARHVDWMRAFLPPTFRIFQNTILPSLPVADASVDLVIGCSVFTHIDNLEFGWLMELARILRPGGMAFLTVHSDMLWERLGNHPSHQWLTDVFSKKLKHPFKCSKETFLKPMPLPRITFWNKRAELYNADVFHHREYLYREWGRFFTIKEIIPEGICIQDLVVMQKE